KKRKRPATQVKKPKRPNDQTIQVKKRPNNTSIEASRVLLPSALLVDKKCHLQQKNIQPNSLGVVDNYPNIHVTRFDGNQKKRYLYKIFRLGYYPSNVKQTQRSGYLIPNEYLVSIKIRGVDLMAETRYDSNNQVIYTLTWDSSDRKKQSVSSNKSASNVATLFLQ
ncbi:10647_t:CDS:2, partial [Racocetra persica]